MNSSKFHSSRGTWLSYAQVDSSSCMLQKYVHAAADSYKAARACSDVDFVASRPDDGMTG